MNYTKTNITNIGDPFVLYENGVYYMYATSSADGIIVWKGENLEKLEKAGLCYLKEESFGYECFWAPEVVKRSDGKYVMHLTARDRADGKLRTGVAVADNPEGIFHDVVKGRAMFDCGTATIDASCFVDSDGSAYLYFVKDCSTNIINGIHTSQIFAAKLSSDLTKIEGEPVLIAEPSQEWESKSLPACCMTALKNDGGHGEYFVWNEGPSVIKHENKYYLTYSANCYDSRFYSVGVAVAEKPMGPFVKCRDNPAMQYIDNEISGPGHNSFFTDKNGKLMCAFHVHTHYDSPSGNRRFCYCGTEFKDGKLRLLYR